MTMTAIKQQKKTKQGVLALLILTTLLYVIDTLPKYTLYDLSGTTRMLQGTISTSSTDPFASIIDLRGLYFGTSRTWGTGLTDFLGPGSRYHAYPWKTTRSTKNLAQRGTGPAYASMCFKSLLEEEDRFDFVVFEYSHILNNPAEKKLFELASRVRSRFPNATLIFIKMPLPLNIMKKKSEQLTPFIQLMEQKNIKIEPGIYDPITHPEVDQLLEETLDDEWLYNDPIQTSDYIYETAAYVGGHVWNPIANAMADPKNIGKADVRKLSTMFFKDANHYSLAGHNEIGYALRQLLVASHATRSDVVNEWDMYDKCESWYQTGQTTFEHSPGMAMYSWAADPRDNDILAGKHALEVDPTGSWIKFSNPTDRDLSVFVYYMITLPQKDYPTTNIIVSTDQDLTTGLNELQLQIDPRQEPINGVYYKLHIVAGSQLGMVGPGDHYMHFLPMEQSKYPFRVTSIALTEDTVEAATMRIYEY